MNETDTCHTYVIPKLKSADWEDEAIAEQLVLVSGMIVPIGERHIAQKCLPIKVNALRPQEAPFLLVGWEYAPRVGYHLFLACRSKEGCDEDY